MKRYLISKMLKSWKKRDQAILAGKVLPDGVEEIRDVAYLDDGHSGHLMDVYYPAEAKGELPFIIDIHGGGFLYGDKELNRLYGHHLARRGFAVFNVNYRLALNDTNLPGQLADLAAAVAFISANAERFRIAPEKGFITGESAGGILAVMTALIAQSARLQEMFATGEPGLDFKAAAVTFGMMDIDDKHIGYWGLRSMCLEKGYKKQPYYQNLIFANIPEMATLAPVFLATSADDVLSPSMKNFERTLKRWGVESEMQYYERRKDRKLVHMFNVFYPEYEESVEMMDRMTEFFLRRIK